MMFRDGTYNRREVVVYPLIKLVCRSSVDKSSKVPGSLTGVKCHLYKQQNHVAGLLRG